MESTFSERLAYARWVWELSHAADANDKAFAERAGVNAAWLAKWKNSERAPTGFPYIDPVAAALGVDTRWLVSGSGNPPRPDLWSDWIAKRHHASARRDPPVVPSSLPAPDERRAPAKKAANDGDRKRGRR